MNEELELGNSVWVLFGASALVLVFVIPVAGHCYRSKTR